MNIEILKPGKMTTTGHSLLRAMQDSDTPALDLLVRESVQNSLDAACSEVDRIQVRFQTGEFVPGKLNSHLEGISEQMDLRHPSSRARFISIRDCNTTGLTGPISHSDRKLMDNDFGNYHKLVNEISREQRSEGAGGSWGLGKTVYFRIGDGLVLYYSRIREDGAFHSRLVACMVEDELREDCVIPRASDTSGRSGIAWWGRINSDEPEEILPLTEESDIRQILALFDLDPYQDQETGTCIIIPYIDEERLLENNRMALNEDEQEVRLPWWYESVESYLTVAIQRWYSPRLDNRFYAERFQGSAWLEASVNGEKITLSRFEPVFWLIQKLYNTALGTRDAGLENRYGIEPDCHSIATRGVLQDSSAGRLCFYSFTREQLHMNAPDNLPDPYAFFGIRNRSATGNSPVMIYVRRPGMVINYEDSGPWVSSVPPTESDAFVLGVFALNSENRLQSSPDTRLEEYVRLSEKSNHRSWSDHDSSGLGNLGIVGRIQKGVSSRLRSALLKDERKKDARVNQSVGRKLAALFLPPEGFGTSSAAVSTGSQNNGTGCGRISQTGVGNLRLEIDRSSIRFCPELCIDARLEARSTTAGAGVYTDIITEGGSVTMEKWKTDCHQKPPFHVTAIDFRISRIDKRKCRLCGILSPDQPEIQMEDMTLRLEQQDGFFCGLLIDVDPQHSFQLQLTFHMKVDRQDVEPAFRAERRRVS